MRYGLPNGAAAPFAGGPSCCGWRVGKKSLKQDSPKNKTGPLPGPLISCARPVENGLKEPSALLFLRLLLYVQ